MSLSSIWPKEDRPLTVDDLLRLPDDGNRYELVHGDLVVSPAALGIHDLVVSRLVQILGALCPDELDAVPGLGFNLAVDLHRIPDVTVVRMESYEDDFQTKPALLAVEVASRSTRRVDTGAKKGEYAEFGIESYWIVTPDRDKPSLMAYELRGRTYEQVALVAGDEAFETRRPFDLTIVPSLLVARGKEWRSLMS